MPSNDKIIKTIRYNGTVYDVGIQTEASASEKGLMSASDKSKLDNITAGATNTTISATTPIIASASTGSVSLTHAASGPSSSGDTSKGDTSNQSPVWGESFKAISATVNKYGHTTALAEHTVTIPNSTATTSAAGLMAAGDKSKLDGIASGATNTTISATAPINASASTGSVSLTHSTSGPSTSGDTSKGDTTAQTPGWGETFKVTSETVDKYGHTKTLADHTVTIPNATASTSAAGLMSAGDKSKLDGVASGATNTTISATSPIAASASTGAVTLTHATSGPSTSGDTSKGDTGNQTPSWGGTFKVTSGTVDKYGHTKTFAEHTVAIPNATASTTAAGLMSAADKSKLDGIASGAGVNTDTKQNITLAATSKAYLTGVTTAPTATVQALTGVADTGVYLTTTSGEINATQYKINEKAYMRYITSSDAIGFTFV